MAKRVVLAGACRTAIGKMGGALSNTPAADLGAIVIKEALNRAGVAPELVDEVKMGCVIQAAQGQNVARQASIKAGLPIEVPAITLNVVCGSGLKCVNDAATMILAGEADIVVAGGMENMSMAPYAMTKARLMMKSYQYQLRLRKKSLILLKMKDHVLEQQLSLFLNYVAAQVKRADLLQLVMHQESMMVQQQL